MNGKKNHSAFCRHVRDKYKRKFQSTQLERILRNRGAIKASAALQLSHRHKFAVPRDSVSSFPDMEEYLAVRIRELRSCGIVVESFMVDAKARILMHTLYPKVCPNSPDPLGRNLDTFGFKCSNTWRRNFFKRHGFLLKTIGKRVNMKGTENERMDTIESFHLQTCLLQLSGTSDPVYGFTSL